MSLKSTECLLELCWEFLAMWSSSVWREPFLLYYTYASTHAVL